MRIIKLLAVVLCFVQIPAAAAPPDAKIVSVKKIWDQAPHNAFTDLTYWKSQFVCAFREGRAHVATDGKIRVLTSPDGENWSPAAQLSLEGYDLRDAGLSVMPDGRLMLNGGAAPRKSEKEQVPTSTFVAFSNDATTWTKPAIVTAPDRWMWRVSWHDGKAYGVAYASHRANNDLSTQLLVSSDGSKFTPLVKKLLDAGWPTEATLRFAKDGTMYCLQRRDGEPRWQRAYFGASSAPYTDWTWHELNIHLGGPNFLQLPSGEWLAAGRVFPDKKKPVTAICSLNIEKPAIKPILELPSGGDCSYPGLVWHDNMLWMSYYSSHEGKTSIYLAKVQVK
jgi:hypothetical protein